MSEETQPIGGHLALMGLFSSLVGGFMLWFRQSGRQLPDRIAPADAALVTVGAHKLARLVTKDKVSRPLRAPFTEVTGDGGPGELDETPKPGGPLRYSIGQLLVCPFCLSMWTTTAFSMGLLVWPRLTRWVAGVLSMYFGAELLQIVYKRAEDSL